MKFQKAIRSQSRLRMAIDGPSGSGKTYTALRFAFALGSKVALIDTEHGSASKYSGEEPDGVRWDFDVCELSNYSPSEYTTAIEQASKAGYEVLVIDSLSHAWAGEGGALEMADRQQGNKFTVWRNITPLHNRMVEAILRSSCHVIVTMRSKTEYIIESDERGRQVPRKVGLAPIQRPGIEFEFDLYCSLDWNHILTVSKSRCPAMVDAIAAKPNAEFISPLIDWLAAGMTAAQSHTNTSTSLEQQIQPISNRKQQLISRINQLWQREVDLGSQIPVAETILTLSDMSEDKLCELGKSIAARVKSLEAETLALSNQD